MNNEIEVIFLSWPKMFHERWSSFCPGLNPCFHASNKRIKKGISERLKMGFYLFSLFWTRSLRATLHSSLLIHAQFPFLSFSLFLDISNRKNRGGEIGEEKGVSPYMSDFPLGVEITTHPVFNFPFPPESSLQYTHGLFKSSFRLLAPFVYH